MFVAALIDAVPELRRRVLDDVAAVLPAAAGIPMFATGTSAGLTVLRFELEGHYGGHPTMMTPAATGTWSILSVPADLSDGTADHAVCDPDDPRRSRSGDPWRPGGCRAFPRDRRLGLADGCGSRRFIIAALDAPWSASDLPLGGGRVATAHGMLPVPAPPPRVSLMASSGATMGWGRARHSHRRRILRHLAVGASRSGGRLAGTGMGAEPATCRHAEHPASPGFRIRRRSRPMLKTVAVLSFEIDDMTGEEIGVAADRLRAPMACSTWRLATLSGKKGRP